MVLKSPHLLKLAEPHEHEVMGGWGGLLDLRQLLNRWVHTMINNDVFYDKGASPMDSFQ